LLAGAVAVGLLSGCARSTRKPVFPVRGTVLVNGQPAKGAKLFFNPVETDPEALAPFGVADDKGSFSLTTYDSFDGAPAGRYVVVVRWRGLKGYDNPKTSKLTATVEKKPNELPPLEITTK
jgi:hypothetical protein